MSTVGGKSSNKDPAWNYFEPNPNDPNATKCKFCGKVTKGGIYRGKQHLVGGFRNAKACPRCPPSVKQEIAELMNKKKYDKDVRNMTPEDDGFRVDGSSDDDDVVHADRSGPVDCSSSRKRACTSSVSSIASNPKGPKQKGPIDVWLAPDPEISARKNKSRQPKLNENDAAKKKLRKRACRSFARWMYDAGIPFNACSYDSFQVFVQAVGQYGPDMKAPTPHEVRVPLLKQEVENTRKAMKDHEEAWAKYGCSIMCDGWKDKRERTLINFLVNCPKGSMFLESVDASAYAKTGEK